MKLNRLINSISKIAVEQLPKSQSEKLLTNCSLSQKLKTAGFAVTRLIAINLGLMGLSQLASHKVFAAPQGAAVQAGAAKIVSSGSTTTITQTSDRAVVNWNSFSVAAGETVQFKVPNINSATLNRVTGTTQSQINGTINSNGLVYLVNPNGLVFDTGSRVSVGGFVATTANIADKSFMAGNGNSQMEFDKASIVKGVMIKLNGDIKVMPHGAMVVFGPNISVGKMATFSSNKGEIVLANYPVAKLSISKSQIETGPAISTNGTQLEFGINTTNPIQTYGTASLEFGINATAADFGDKNPIVNTGKIDGGSVKLLTMEKPSKPVVSNLKSEAPKSKLVNTPSFISKSDLIAMYQLGLIDYSTLLIETKLYGIDVPGVSNSNGKNSSSSTASTTQNSNDAKAKKTIVEESHKEKPVQVEKLKEIADAYARHLNRERRQRLLHLDADKPQPGFGMGGAEQGNGSDSSSGFGLNLGQMLEQNFLNDEIKLIIPELPKSLPKILEIKLENISPVPSLPKIKTILLEVNNSHKNKLMLLSNFKRKG